MHVTRKQIIILIVIGAFCFIIFKLVTTLHQLNVDSEENLAPTYVLSKEDSSLFSDSVMKRIEVREICQNKNRNPVALLLLDKKYDLLVHEIDLQTDNSLTSIIHQKDEANNLSVGYSYRIINDNLFNFENKAGKAIPVKDIFFSVDGDLINNAVSNDSALYYSLRCRSFGFKYSLSAPMDIYMVRRAINFDSKPMPMDILFLKRDKKMFCMILTATQMEQSIPPGFLLDVVMKRIDYGK